MKGGAMKPIHVKRSTNVILSGVALSLFALIVLLSYGTPFSFLTTAICASFGFIGFWVLTPFLLILGLYIAFRKKLIQFKLGLSLWGIFIVVLSFMIITSNWGSSEEISFANCIDLLKEQRPYDPFSNPNIGGGFFGYVLAGILNNAITIVGTKIICWVMFAAGIVMILNKQIVLLIKKIKNRKHKEKEVEHRDVQVIEEYEQPVSEPEVISEPEVKESEDQAMLRSMVLSSYNSTHGFQKARFNFGEPKQQKVEQSSFNAASFPEQELVVEKQPELVQPEQFVQPTFSFENEAPTVGPVQEEENYSEPVQEEAPITDPTHRPQPRAVVRQPYAYPDVSLLTPHESPEDIAKNDASCAERTDIMNTVFNDLNIGASIVGHTVGPSVTRYDVKMNSNVSVSTIDRYCDDISIRLNGVPVRFEKLVPGKATSGLEVPNAIRTNVGLFESIQKMKEKGCKPMEIIFGKNISGDLLTADITKFPHMLVAGTTGSGKSIFMHATILTLIMRNSPENLKLILIDPKKVEMSYYENIPHLLCPNISEPHKANVAFNKLVVEMERRYNLFQSARVRDIGEFNNYAKANGITPLPFILVFVDEYADLSESCKEIRTPVVRIAQKARSAGIHLVIATQRPSVNVIDGVIKANVPVHVALMTSNATDSVTIIGEGGAEQLLGNGDMLVECSLISRNGCPRVQGCFVASDEINSVCDDIRAHNPVQYDPYFLDLEHDPNEPTVSSTNSGADQEVTKVDKNIQEEKLYEIIKEDISTREYCSISFLTRSYAIGFPKAGRLFNRLIKEGYVASSGDARGSKVLKRVMPQQQQIGSFEQSEFIPNEEIQDVNNIEEEQDSFEQEFDDQFTNE